MIDEKNFKDIKIIDDNEIEYLKNEIEKIKIMNECTKEILIENNIKINDIEKEDIKKNINNKNLEVVYKYKEKNILNKIYLSIISIFTGIYLIMKR